MDRYKFSKEHKPGTWGYIETGDIRIICKYCGAHMRLDTAIDSSGIICQDVACYVCGFHECIQLLGWKE